VVAIDNLTNTQVLKLKGRIFTLTVVQLLNKDVYAFEHQIEEVVNKAPKLFYKIPVVLDCSLLQDELTSFLPYFLALKKFHLYPIGVQGNQAWVAQLAGLQTVPVFQSSAANDKPIQQKKPSLAPTTATQDLGINTTSN
jgi:septum site-determining protein MinC